MCRCLYVGGGVGGGAAPLADCNAPLADSHSSLTRFVLKDGRAYAYDSSDGRTRWLPNVPSHAPPEPTPKHAAQ